MKIQNFEELGVSNARSDALAITEAALQSIDTERVVRSEVRREGDIVSVAGARISLTGKGRLIVSGVGKCAGIAAKVIEDIIGDFISDGAVISLGNIPELSRITSYRGTHPFPSEDNVNGAKAITQSLSGLTEEDIVLFIVTGGGSTMLCLPDDRGCEEEAGILKVLMMKGAPIQEINVVRKHLSLARGGHMAKYAYPARVIVLVFSDVATDDLSSIASGPMVRDGSTIEDAERILEKYDVLRACNIESCGLIETPKEDRYFARVTHKIVVSNQIALEAMAARARDLGYVSRIVTRDMTGEARDEARKVIASLHEMQAKSVLLYGGETTVTVSGRGRGGRNLEFSLAGLSDIREGEILMAVASDGRDNGPYAGAICDTITKREVVEAGIDWEEHLRNNDEYPLFEKIGNYLMTGDTGSNVADLVIALKSE